MKVGGSTTLGELALIRAQLGIVVLKIDYSFEFIEPVLVTAITEHIGEDGAIIVSKGRGQTEAEALDDAFSRLTHRLGAEVLYGSVRAQQ